MRVLGMAAFVMTVAAAVLNVIWFTQRGISVGEFFALTWPAALTAAAVVGGALAVGIVSVRMMLKAEAEQSEEKDSPPEG